MIRAAVLALWAYYLLFSLVAPPIVTDAHIYDLARLYVIRQGGLFHNTIFAHSTQVAFPWTFDAIHWPLVRLGFGYALPSFACLTGVLVVTFLAVREAYDEDVAWRALLALLALPTLVYQATSSKTDIGVVFGVFAWFHAMRRFRHDGRRRSLAWAALAIAFAGGAKTSGLPIAALLAAGSLWTLRRQPRLAAFWAGCFVVAGVLFLSGETYLANVGTFHDPIGPGGYRTLRNNDGVAGAAANVVRHVAYNVDLGTDLLAGRKWVLSAAMERLCRQALVVLGLADRGHGWQSTDATLDFYKAGHEAQDGFGPLGTLALVVVPWVLVRRRPAEWPWRLAASAVVLLAVTAYTVGFGMWVNRFLMLPAAFGVLATVLHLDPLWRRSAVVRALGVAVMLYAALAPPAFSFARKPSDVWRSISDRDAILTLEMPANRPVLEAVRATLAACPASVWVVTTHQIAAQFLFYDLLRDREVLARPANVTAALLAEVQRTHPGRALHVLALDQDLPARISGLVETQTFPGEFPDRSNTRIYRYGDGSCAG